MLFKQDQGFTLIGILIVVLIIGMLGFGGSYFMNRNSSNAQSLKKSIDNQLNKLKENVDKANTLKQDALNSTENTINEIKNTDSQMNKAKDSIVNSINKIKAVATTTE